MPPDKQPECTPGHSILLRDPVLITIGSKSGHHRYDHKANGVPNMVLYPESVYPESMWPRELAIKPFPNFGVPGDKHDAAWWLSVATAIKSDPAIKHVHVMCEFGHGRSGTMAAVLLQLLGPSNETVQETIDFIRKAHCEKAVEKQEQVDWIHKIVGEANELRRLDPTASHPIL